MMTSEEMEFQGFSRTGHPHGTGIFHPSLTLGRGGGLFTTEKG
jgi:hypothetical protein